MISAQPRGWDGCPVPEVSGGDGQGWDGQGQESGCQPKLGAPPSPAWHPHLSVSAGERAHPMQSQDPNPLLLTLPCFSADAGIQSPRLSFPLPSATGPTPFPGMPRPPSLLCPVPCAPSPPLSSQGWEGRGRCWLLAGMGTGRGWGVSPLWGSAEHDGCCKGHEAAEPHSHSHSQPGGHHARRGGLGPCAVGEVFSMNLQEEGVEDGARPGAGEELGQQLGAAGELTVGAAGGAE